MKRIFLVGSSFMTIKAFMLPHIRMLSEKYTVIVVVNDPALNDLAEYGLDIPVVYCPIKRNIAPVSDLLAISSLCRLIMRHKPDVIHSISPKAGMVSMIAGFMCGTLHRVHMFTGQVWVTRRGVPRAILKIADRLIAACSTRCLVDSKTQLDFLVEEKVLKRYKASVLGHGSVSGVNLEKFSRDESVRNTVRSEFGVGDNDVLFLFLGRLKLDKGVVDLANAFARLQKTHDNAHLLIVGPDEEGLQHVIEERLHDCNEKLHMVDYTDKPYEYLSASDVFCLPSYREGFGSVVIEAAASGLPAIASDIYGIQDSVMDGVTGLLHQTADVDDILKKMVMLSEDAGMREKMGAAARIRAKEYYSEDVLVDAMENYYRQMLA